MLAPVTDADVSNAALPYLTARELAIGRAPVLAVRVTYVGELGWELYAPSEYGLELWDALWEAGRPHGLVAAGYRAIDSLRLEKGYRYWSADITPDDTPFEAGLGFAVKLGKGDFVGREALARQKAEGVRRKLCCLTLADPRAVALGGEPVRMGGDVVGPRHQRRLRLQRGAEPRLRLPAGRAGDAGDGRRRRGLRRLGAGHRRRRAPLGPEGRARPRLSRGQHHVPRLSSRSARHVAVPVDPEAQRQLRRPRDPDRHPVPTAKRVDGCRPAMVSRPRVRSAPFSASVMAMAWVRRAGPLVSAREWGGTPRRSAMLASPRAGSRARIRTQPGVPAAPVMALRQACRP